MDKYRHGDKFIVSGDQLMDLVIQENWILYGKAEPHIQARHKGKFIFAAYDRPEEFDSYEVQVYNKERLKETKFK